MVGAVSTSVFAPLQPPPPKEGGGNVLTATSGGEELTEEEKKVVQELKQTDAEVRAHEQAHKGAAGPYGGAVSFETVTGPDGREYAVAGEVQIDASPVPGNPEATIRKADVVARAALAPAKPSSQDQAVARAAQQAKLQAQQEVQEKGSEEETDPSKASVLSALEAYKQANELAQEAPSELDSAQDATQEIISAIAASV